MKFNSKLKNEKIEVEICPLIVWHETNTISYSRPLFSVHITLQTTFETNHWNCNGLATVDVLSSYGFSLESNAS